MPGPGPIDADERDQGEEHDRGYEPEHDPDADLEGATLPSSFLVHAAAEARATSVRARRQAGQREEDEDEEEESEAAPAVARDRRFTHGGGTQIEVRSPVRGREEAAAARGPAHAWTPPRSSVAQRHDLPAIDPRFQWVRPRRRRGGDEDPVLPPIVDDEDGRG